MVSRVPTVAQEGVLGGQGWSLIPPSWMQAAPVQLPRGPQAFEHTTCVEGEAPSEPGDTGTGRHTASSPLLQACTLVLAHLHTCTWVCCAHCALHGVSGCAHTHTPSWTPGSPSVRRPQGSKLSTVDSVSPFVRQGHRPEWDGGGPTRA